VSGVSGESGLGGESRRVSEESGFALGESSLAGESRLVSGESRPVSGEFRLVSGESRLVSGGAGLAWGEARLLPPESLLASWEAGFLLCCLVSGEPGVSGLGRALATTGVVSEGPGMKGNEEMVGR